MAAEARVIPLDVELSVEPGETVFEAAWRQGYSWPTRCMGQGICTQCMLEVRDGAEHVLAPEAEEAATLVRLKAFHGTTADIRLACRLKIDGPVVVHKEGVKRQ